MDRVAYAGIVALAICLYPLPGQAQAARGIAETTFPSVVLLVMQDANGQTISLGSGFFVEGDVIATNFHVIEKAKQGYAKIVGQNRKYDVVGFVGLDPTRDLALLKLRGVSAPTLRMGDSNEVAVGDQVYVVGNPRGLEGTFSTGIVSGIRRFSDDSLLQITAPISPGSSGGPVLDSFGRVIGIAVGAFKAGESLNFAVPVSSLKALLDNMTPEKALPVRAIRTPQKGTVLDQGPKGVVGTHFRWGLELEYGPVMLLKEIEFTLSIRNDLREPIKDVHYLVVFYDGSNKPVDVYEHQPGKSFFGTGDPETIQPGLAKRVTGSVNRTVRPLTARVEIRILDFKFVE